MLVRDHLLALSVATAWGVNFVVMKMAVDAFPPLLLTALRFGLAAIPLVFFVRPPAVPWRLLVGYGAMFGVVKFSLLFLAFKFGMPSGLAASVLQTQAFLTIMLAAILLSERTTGAQQAGIVVAAAGLGLIASAVNAEVRMLPVALTFAAALAWAFANILLKRMGRADMLSVAVYMSLVPPLPMLGLSLMFEGPELIATSLARVDWRGLAAVLYLAYPINIVTTAIWGRLLTTYPAAAVAPYALLVPVIAWLAGWIVFDERFGWTTVVGAVLILVGLGVSTLSARLQRKDA